MVRRQINALLLVSLAAVSFAGLFLPIAWQGAYAVTARMLFDYRFQGWANLSPVATVIASVGLAMLELLWRPDQRPSRRGAAVGLLWLTGFFLAMSLLQAREHVVLFGGSCAQGAIPGERSGPIVAGEVWVAQVILWGLALVAHLGSGRWPPEFDTWRT